MNIKVSERICVMTFDDHADGQAYLSDFHHVRSLTQAYEWATLYIQSHDHVLITATRDVCHINVSEYHQLLPYSISIDKGQYSTLS